jgi:hypothetical protein
MGEKEYREEGWKGEVGRVRGEFASTKVVGRMIGRGEMIPDSRRKEGERKDIIGTPNMEDRCMPLIVTHSDLCQSQ